MWRHRHNHRGTTFLVGNKNDPNVLSFMEKVKIAELECRDCNGVYVKPYQANIALSRYPMVRPLYYILKENYDGVGSGFSNFLIYEKRSADISSRVPASRTDGIRREANGNHRIIFKYRIKIYLQKQNT